jgi:GNAT superfamily N-acetyltransferase
MSFAVDPEYQNRGLGKLLTSLIFKINTNIKRIFLCTRVTNNIALNAYKNWGFTLDSNPILDHTFNLEHWTFLEYKIDKTNILQKIAEGLKEIK